MAEKIVADGVYQVIIYLVSVIHFESGPIGALDLELIITNGPYKEERLSRKLFLGKSLEEAKCIFTRLGGSLRSADTVDEDAAKLPGALLKVQVKRDDAGRIKPLIHGFIGRDNIQNYVKHWS